MRVWDWQVGHLAAPPFQLPGDGFALECPLPGEYILVSCAMRSRNLSVCDVRGLKNHNISVVSLDELRLEAQLLSGSTLEKHGVVPLNTSDWLTRWEDKRNFLDEIELKQSGSQ
jgi:hypothetical protein